MHRACLFWAAEKSIAPWAGRYRQKAADYSNGIFTLQFSLLAEQTLDLRIKLIFIEPFLNKMLSMLDHADRHAPVHHIKSQK